MSLKDTATVRVDKPARLYLPQLDSLRFLAFLCVFFFHGLPSNDVNVHVGAARTTALLEATVHRSLENGVGMFFLLSAYLITELLRREKKTTGTIHVRNFYLRRTLRIWPLYYLVVAIGLVLSALSRRFFIPPGEVWSYLLFWKNWYLALHGPSWNPIYILWTVSAEEQFYAAWPLMQKYCGERVIFVLCGLLFVAIPWIAFTPSGYFYTHGASQIPYLFFYFPVGSVLAYWLRGRSSFVGIRSCITLVLGGAMLWLAGTYLSYPADREALSYGFFLVGRVAILTGTISIFLGFLWSDPRWSFRSMVYCGRISYGLYVFHIMAFLLASAFVTRWGFLTGHHSFGDLAIGLALKFAVAFGLTLSMAALSYELFEKRFLALKDRLAFVRSLPGG